MKRRIFILSALSVCAAPVFAETIPDLNATIKLNDKNQIVDATYQQMLSYVNSLEGLLKSASSVFSAADLQQAHRILGAIQNYARTQPGKKWMLLLTRVDAALDLLAKVYQKNFGGDVAADAKKLAEKLKQPVYPPIVEAR